MSANKNHHYSDCDSGGMSGKLESSPERTARLSARVVDRIHRVRDSTKAWLDVIQPAMTVLGIMAAGWWFFAQSNSATKLTTSVTVDARELTDTGYTLYSVLIKVTNSGLTPVVINYASASVERLLPVDTRLKILLEAQKKDQIWRDTEKTIVSWPRVGSREKNPQLTLYPSDTDFVMFDVVIESEAELIRINSAVAARRPIAPGTATWTQSTLVESPSVKRGKGAP